MCLHIEVKDSLGCCSSDSVYLVSSQATHWPGIHQLDHVDWPESLRDLPGSGSQLWGYKCVPPHQNVYMGSGDHSGHLDSGKLGRLIVSLAT